MTGQAFHCVSRGRGIPAAEPRPRMLPHFPAQTPAYSSAAATPGHPLWLPQPRDRICAPQRAFSTGSTSPTHLRQVIWRDILPSPDVPHLSGFPVFASTGPPTQILPISKTKFHLWALGLASSARFCPKSPSFKAKVVQRSFLPQWKHALI